MTELCEVYVRLLDEGTEVSRPVNAELVGPGLFRLLGPVPNGEVWEFQPGEIVRCRRCEGYWFAITRNTT
jgi:hypothetical protein